MKTKLILLNGPPGIGKSTLAQTYIDNHPMALKLDIDTIWHMMGHWQANIDVSAPQAQKIACAIAEMHLLDGYDVIVPQDIVKIEISGSFERIARKCGAILKEVTLIAPVDEAIERCKSRAISQGHEIGFRPGGILDTGGREELLKEMYTQMMSVAQKRPATVWIRSNYGNPEETYQQLLAALD